MKGFPEAVGSLNYPSIFKKQAKKMLAGSSLQVQFVNCGPPAGVSGLPVEVANPGVILGRSPHRLAASP